MDRKRSGLLAGRITLMLADADSARRSIPLRVYADDEAMGTGFSLALRLVLL